MGLRVRDTSDMLRYAELKERLALGPPSRQPGQVVLPSPSYAILASPLPIPYDVLE